MADYTTYNYYAIGDGNSDGAYIRGPLVADPNGVQTQLVAYGTLAAPVTTAIAGNKLVQYYATSTDTGDNNRLFYTWYNASGIGGGFECFRGRVVGTVTGLNAIRGGNFTAALDASTSNISGMAAGVQATFEALAATKTIGGTIASLVCTSFVGAGNTLPASHSFIRCVDEGSVGFTNLFDLSSFTEGTNSSSVLCTSSSDHTATHNIKIRGAGGVTMWLLATTTTPA